MSLGLHLQSQVQEAYCAVSKLGVSQLSHESHVIHYIFVSLTAVSSECRRCCCVAFQWECRHGRPGQSMAAAGRTRPVSPGHAWEEQTPCTGFLLSPWPLQGALKPACANFCFETPFFCRRCARADSHLRRGLCEQQARTFLMEVPADTKKKEFGFYAFV